MERLDKRVAGSLTRFYVVALCVVALLTMSGLFLIRRTISSLNHDGRIVNVAGRQRMLSQRLTKLSLLKIEDRPIGDTASFVRLLSDWKQNHENLAHRKLSVDKDFVTWKSAPLDSMFAELNPVFGEMYAHFQRIDDQAVPLAQKEVALTRLLALEPVFLGKMNQIVFQFDKESFERLENLERIEWILDVMTILVLLAEGLLIFRPVVNTTRRVVRMLSESEDALQGSNEKLRETNSRLLEAQHELLKLEEEKYQLKLQEDRVRSASLLEGQEEERKRFALELHDGIGQMLTGLRLHAEKLNTVPFQEEKHKRSFQRLTDLIQEIIKTTRQVSFNLMPSVLNDFGLVPALRLLAEQNSDSSGISTQFTAYNTDEMDLPRQAGIALYRIAQEALNNAVKHAEATEIHVSIRQTGSRVVLEVTDNGKGFAPDTLSSDGSAQALIHHGIENIRTRTALMNGEVEIISAADAGTSLIVTVDL